MFSASVHHFHWRHKHGVKWRSDFEIYRHYLHNLSTNGTLSIVSPVSGFTLANGQRTRTRHNCTDLYASLLARTWRDAMCRGYCGCFFKLQLAEGTRQASHRCKNATMAHNLNDCSSVG